MIGVKFTPEPPLPTHISHTHTHTDGQILASSEAGQLLKNSPDFRVTENATIPIQVSNKDCACARCYTCSITMHMHAYKNTISY